MSGSKRVNRLKDLLIRACFLWCIGVLLGAVALGQQRAPESCCSITAINPQTGVVAAQVKATGQAFQFHVSNPVLLRGLRVGQDVYANLRTRQVSIDGKTACCAITALGPPSDKSGRRTKADLEAQPGATQTGVSAPGAKSRPAGDSSGQSPEAQRPSDSTPRPDRRAPVAVFDTKRGETEKATPPQPPSGSTPPPDTPPTGGLLDKTGMEMETRPKKELPRFAYFSCHPGRVIGGTDFTCTAGLHRVSEFPLEVSIASSNKAVARPYYPYKITIPPGSRAASLQIWGLPQPQSAPVTISASDGRTQRSAMVTVLPAAIEEFFCSIHEAGRCLVLSGGRVLLGVRLSAPAPASGYSVPVTPHKDNPEALQRALTITVNPGDEVGGAYFNAPDVPNISGSFEVTDSVDGSVKAVRIDIGPRVKSVSLSTYMLSEVPVRGTKVAVGVRLNGPYSGFGLVHPVQYGGTTDVKGPARIVFMAESTKFVMTVFPCEVNAPCTVWVEVQGQRATLTVNP